MKIAIRADASLTIGSGHIMRCLTLASLLKQQRHDITFICRKHDGHLADFISQKGFDVEVLAKGENLNFAKIYTHSEWLGVSELDDFTKCQPILTDLQPDWLIIDHYAIGKVWEEQAKQLLPMLKILVIDDLADREHDCEILLDQNFGRVPSDYQGLVGANCRLLLGTRYALLRSEFRHWREYSLSRRKKIIKPKSILINLGGVDKDNVTLTILQALQANISQSHLSFHITVVMGKTAPHIKSVQDFASQMSSCQILVAVSDMAELMANSDIAIGAAGSTTWERCCIGLPMVLVVLADNQKVIADSLSRKNVVKMVENIDQLPQDLPNILNEVTQSYQRLSYQSASLVDGQGATRVIKHLALFSRQNHSNIRFATLKDAERVWHWRNHVDVRQWMFSQDEITLNEHKKWFSQKLTSPNVTLLIFEQNGEPLGFANVTNITIDKSKQFNKDISQVKNHVVRNIASWGFYLSPNSPKGQGLGFILGILVIGKIFNYTNINTITAQVFAYNTASLALHRKLGFTEIGLLKQSFGVDDKLYKVVEFELLAEQFLY